MSTSQSQHPHDHSHETPVGVKLLGAFEVSVGGETVELSTSAQRLVALLALERRAMPRKLVSGTLWPEKSEERAAANLRSTLWRLKACIKNLVSTNGGSLELADNVAVDLYRLLPEANPTFAEPDLATVETLVSTSTVAIVSDPPAQAELLIDWYDEWVIVERERVRQHTLRALEVAAEELRRVGLFHEAIAAGSMAVKLAPLRESAHRAVIEAHITEGNYAEAVRQYEAFSAVIFDAFGIGPSEHLTSLFSHFPGHNTKAG